MNGVNTVFTLASAPSPAASLELYRNGLLQRQGADYQISANTITFFLASIPQTGDLLVASYRFANPSDPLSSLASPQVICSSTGSGTSGTALIELGSCTIPAGLLVAGDRLEVQFQYAHTGTAYWFHGCGADRRHDGRIARGGRRPRLCWQGNQLRDLRKRPGVGHPDLGNRASLAANAGTASEDTAQAIRVSLQGQMAGTTSDSVFLRNFTVIRYPAQANP